LSLFSFSYPFYVFFCSSSSPSSFVSYAYWYFPLLHERFDPYGCFFRVWKLRAFTASC
jgi:hypothetical protein